jgi:hypothetical protein
MPDDRPSFILVIGCLSLVVGTYAGLWYLSLWLYYCKHCTGIPLAYLLMVAFYLIFLFAAYMLIRMLFPARTGPLSIPH